MCVCKAVEYTNRKLISRNTRKIIEVEQETIKLKIGQPKIKRTCKAYINAIIYNNITICHNTKLDFIIYICIYSMYIIIGVSTQFQ